MLHLHVTMRFSRRNIFARVASCFLVLIGICLPSSLPAAPSTFAVFPTDSTWKFNRGTNEASSPSSAWRQAAFNDGSWETGAAPFLYTSAATEPPFWSGGAFAGTTLGDMLNRYTTVYLRKAFVLTNASQAITFTFSAASDDGFVAYINGVEFARRNVSIQDPV